VFLKLMLAKLGSTQKEWLKFVVKNDAFALNSNDYKGPLHINICFVNEVGNLF